MLGFVGGLCVERCCYDMITLEDCGNDFVADVVKLFQTIGLFSMMCRYTLC